jgi:hypothetical protein
MSKITKDNWQEHYPNLSGANLRGVIFAPGWQITKIEEAE